MIYHQLADILYLSDQGIPTKRRIKFLQIKGDCVQAYCYLRNATVQNKKCISTYTCLRYEKGSCVNE